MPLASTRDEPCKQTTKPADPATRYPYINGIQMARDCMGAHMFPSMAGTTLRIKETFSSYTTEQSICRQDAHHKDMNV